jgi:hypothetical protein
MLFEVGLWAFLGELTEKSSQPVTMAHLDEAVGFIFANSQGRVRQSWTESEIEP